MFNGRSGGGRGWVRSDVEHHRTCFLYFNVKFNQCYEINKSFVFSKKVKNQASL